MQNLILLDRNVIITIRHKIDTGKIISERKQKLKKIDDRKNIISPFFSIIEGQAGWKQNQQQMKDTLIKEAMIISSFFQFANVDSNFLINNVETISNIFTNNSIEVNWDNYLSFIIEMQEYLYQSISRNERSKSMDKILEKASLYNIPIGHPLVILSLSVLYGCQDAKYILKAKKDRTEEEQQKAAYNTLNDILVVSRFMTILSAINENMGNHMQLKFFTFDKGLRFFLKNVNLKEANNYQRGEQTHIIGKIAYGQKLFPDLNKDKWLELMENIKCYDLKTGSGGETSNIPSTQQADKSPS